MATMTTVRKKDMLTMRKMTTKTPPVENKATERIEKVNVSDSGE
jgi:hypothetical protein